MSVLSKGKEFWNRFLKYEDKIIQCLNSNEGEPLTSIMEELDDFCTQISGCHFFVETYYDSLELTFDTGPNKTSQYIASELVSIAPESIKKRWIINACLPPLSSKAVQSQVQIKDETYGLQDFFVFYEQIESTETLSCHVYCPGFRLIKNTENKKEMSMYLLELALGECYYESYISSVDFIDVPSNEIQNFCNLVDFYEKLSDLVVEKKWKTYAKPQDIYSVYQPIENIVHDALRKDMKYIFTTHPLLIEDTLENKADVLWDLKSKDGEFGYIYFANPFMNQQDALFRQNLSKKLDEAISLEHAGNVIGGAIGKSFSYIDCIVYDVELFKNIFKQIKKQLDSSIELHYRSFEEDHELN